MTGRGPVLQVLTVTEHADGTIDATVEDWHRGLDVPLTDTLAGVEVDDADLPLTAEIDSLLNTVDVLHDEHDQYVHAMHAAGYDDGMEFVPWQRYAGSRVPPTMPDRQASTGIARSFGPTQLGRLGRRWAGRS